MPCYSQRLRCVYLRTKTSELLLAWDVEDRASAVTLSCKISLSPPYLFLIALPPPSHAKRFFFSRSLWIMARYLLASPRKWRRTSRQGAGRSSTPRLAAVHRGRSEVRVSIPHSSSGSQYYIIDNGPSLWLVVKSLVCWTSFVHAWRESSIWYVGRRTSRAFHARVHINVLATDVKSDDVAYPLPRLLLSHRE